MVVSINSHQLRQLRRILRECVPLATEADLRALFADSRLQAWRYRLPEVATAGDRLDSLIALLVGEEGEPDQQPLIRFLELVRERLGAADPCHRELSDLLDSLQPGPTRPAGEQSTRFTRRRMIDLEQQLAAEYELLNKYEAQLRYSDDPRQMARYQQEIARIRAAISGIKGELDRLRNTS